MTNTEIIQSIRNEIERLKTIQLKRIQEGDLVDAEPYDKNEAYNELLDFLTTLEPEKPMNLEEEISHYLREECSGDDEPSISEIARHFAKWGAEHLATSGKTSPNDIKEAAWEYAPDLPSYNIGGGYLPPQSRDDLRTAFKDGAKWQAEQLLKSSPLPEDTVLFNKGVEEGKRLMMEEAMEGEVMTNGFYPYDPRIVAPYPNCPYDFGDKVRVIVLPKED